MIELKDLRGLTPEELLVKEETLKKELFNLRFQLATGRIESTAQIGHVKRDIARIKTVYREKLHAANHSTPQEAKPGE